MSNKASKRLVPDLRFPEFRDAEEWKQRLIEDFFDVGSSKRVLQQDWTTQGIPFYRTRELVSLSKNKPFGSEIFISKELFREISERYGLPAEGDFLVSGVGTLGISYQVQAQDKFYFKDGNVLWFRLKGGIISTFFKYCFEADEIQKQILGQASISTVGTYTIQNAKVTKFFCPPSTEEQQQIAACLSSIDDLIAAQAKKIEALKAHKNGLMQQLFPAEGETVPRLRFPEFWGKNTETSSLRSIVRFSSGGTPSKDEASYWNGDIPWISASSMYDENISDSECKVTPLAIGNGTRIAPKGSLLILVRGSMLFNRVPLGIAVTDVAFNQDVKALSVCNSVDASFLLFQLLALSKRIPINETGIGAGKIESNVLAELPIYLPSIIEQKKAAKCLSSLGVIITAQTKKLDTLKTFKQGLMQGLFPSVSEAEA